MKKYDPEQMRALLKKQMGGRAQDPNEFKVPKVAQGATLKYRFHVLGPLSAGDPVVGGVASRDMDTFCVTEGVHWVDKRPTPCPKVYSNGEEDCEMCNIGFALINEAKELKASDEVRRQIAQQWLSNTNRLVNIWFPNSSSNPEELRGRTMYYRAGIVVYNMWYAAAMASDPGRDPEDPQAYGMFFDECNSYLFNLIAVKEGDNNGYKQSRFVVSKTEGARPLVANKDGSPNEAAIQRILDQRHDLYTKIDTPDHDKIRKLAARLQSISTGDDFDHDETRPSRPAERTPVVDTRARPTPRPTRSGDLEIPKEELLAGESPLDDEPARPVTTKQATRPAAKPTPKQVEPPSGPDDQVVEDEESNPELDHLMSQLTDAD